MYLPITFRIASLAIVQSYDCANASEITLKDIFKISYQQSITKYGEVLTFTLCSIFLGIVYAWKCLHFQIIHELANQ